MPRTFLSLLLVLVLLGAAPSARAQGAASARLSGIDTAAFPLVRFQLDVFDEQGAFVTGLSAQDLRVLESGQPRSIDSLVDLQPGLQLVVAVNPGSPLAVRDAQGVDRYQKVLRALLDWADLRPPDSQDDLSLVTTAGTLIEHTGPAVWRDTLAAYQPDLRNASPGLNSLSIAIDIAADQTAPAGGKRAVLFITPHMEQAVLAGLEALLQRASASDVRVIVWLVDSQAYFLHSSAASLQALAARTGGAYFAYSGSETLPDPEKYFTHLRHSYQIEYTSGLTSSGEHTLAVEYAGAGGALSGDPATFRLDVQPPNPILVSPPAQIVREPPAEDPYGERLDPREQPLEIIIEFPDGHPRPLVSTALYVDGVKVAENSAEPFDTFTWDLSAFDASGQHALQVEAVDSLGLSRLSLSVPVDVTVVRPPSGVSGFLLRYRLWLALGAIGLAGVVMTVILFSRGRRRATREERRRERALYEDPVTQPVQTVASSPARSLFALRARLPSAPAYLFRVRPDGEPASGQPIPILERETTFGYDPVKAMHVLDDPSVADLHARLTQTPDGNFVLHDEGSLAGTWVNYEPLTNEGRRLKHGDLVHLGRLAYRFTLRKPPAREEPRVTPL